MSRALVIVRVHVLAVLGLTLVVTGLQFAAAPAPAIAADEGTHLVINEVSGGNGTGVAATDEYVELYNPTSERIEFTGRILYKSATGTQFSGQGPITTFVVEPHGYWLAAGQNYSGTAPRDSSYSFDISASTTAGGHVLLTGTTGTVTDPYLDPLKVDLVAWGTGNKPETAAAPYHPAAGGSLRRTNGIDTDNNSLDFVVGTRSPRGSSTNGAITLTEPGAKSFPVDTAVTPVTLTAAGGLAPYTYAVSSGSLPDGLTLGASSGQISGTPTVARAAEDVTVRATDGNGDPVYSTFPVEVTGGASPLTLVDVSALGFTVGSPITPFTLTASGGVAPYTFSVTGGQLPGGVSLSPSGLISGTPSAARAAADVTVTVIDSAADSDSTTFSVQVARGTLTTAIPTIDDTTPAVGDVLTASAGAWGPAPVQLAYQWLADGTVIDGATDATLTVTPDLVDAVLAVRVTGSRAEYQTTSVDSADTAAVVASPVAFTTAPSIGGTLAVGQTLTADPGTTVPVAEELSYQWRRDGAPIDGATAATYVLVADDLGADISVTVTASNAGYADGSEISPARGPVVAGTFLTGPTAAIVGTPAVGATLTATTGTTSPAATSFGYAWEADGDAVGTNAASLAVTPGMVGKSITVTVTAQRDGYVDATDESDPTAEVARGTFSTGPAASITGTARVGETLTAVTGTTSPAATSFGFAWEADGDAVGTNAATLAVTPAMVGKTVTVTVTAQRDGYVDATDESDATAEVARGTFSTGPAASITGTARVGETLTAATGTTVPAADSFGYAWEADGEAVGGDTSTLAVTPAMVGKSVTVTVTAERDGYVDAADESEPTAEVARGTFSTGPAASITGTARVGETLTAVTGTTVPAADSFGYVWEADGEAVGGDTATLAVTPVMVGKSVTVTVTAVRGGYVDATDESDPTAEVARGTFSTGPAASITGTARVGETLTAATGATSPAATSYGYAWEADGEAVGTNAATLAVSPAMVGKTITVTVTAQRDGYVDASDESDPTAGVARGTFGTGPTASITGTPVVGATLTASTGITSPAATSFGYAWEADGEAVGGDTPTLAVTPGMVGTSISVTVTAQRDGYVDASDESDATAEVARAAFVTGPTAGITGTPVVGATLTASTGTTSPAATSYDFVWKAGEDPVGTNDDTLVVTPGMVGRSITVTVTAVRDGYVDAADESAPTAEVDRAMFSTGPAASITGTARVGETVTATTGATDPVATSFGYAWRADGDPVGTDTDTLVVTPGMVGKTITVTVTAELDGYVDASDESDPTDEVARAAFVTGPTPGITGTPVVGATLTATTATTTPAATSFGYAWQAGGDPVGDGTDSLTVTPAMVGRTVTVTVTARRDGYVDVADESAPTAPVERATFATEPVASIDGTARVGQVLTASAGTPAPAPDSLSYRWYAGDAVIAGAVGQRLTLTAAQVGRRVSVEVTASRAGFVDAVARSGATVAVASYAAPRLSLRVSVPRSAGKVPDGTPTVLSGTRFTVTWSASGHGDDLDLHGTGAMGELLRKRFGKAPVPARGRIAVRLTRFGLHRFRLHATGASGTTRATAAVTVVRPPARLKVQAPRNAEPGARIRVRVQGLGRGEQFMIRLAGSPTITGRATRDGVVVRRLVVPARASRRERLRIVAFGRTDSRKGSAVVVVR
jgi:hypothetical protein